MAISQSVVKKTLVVVTSDGVTTEGEAKYKSTIFGGIRSEATNENLLAVGNSLASLFEETCQYIAVNQKLEMSVEA